MMFFLLVLVLFESISGKESLDCAYNEWQCGDECIRDYKACNGTCPEWDWKCTDSRSWYNKIADCIHYGELCYGGSHCDDGSDEEDCPKDCEIPVRDTLDNYFGTKNGVVNCNGKKICAGDPCNGKCLRYVHSCILANHFTLIE